jgi:hypothetical protein
VDAETTTGFSIDGKVYELPGFDTLSQDETELMYLRCGLLPEDFVPEEGETEEEHDARLAKLMRHPGFMRALMEIAYQRGNPTVKAAAVATLIGQTNRQEAMSTLVGDEPEEPEVPLASTSEPSEASARSSLSSESSTRPHSETSGDGSMNGSAQTDDQPEPTGTTKSDTSSPLSIAGT